MSRRGIAAATVLTAWALGLGVLFARELNPSLETKLTEAALRIVPITTYFAVERDGKHIGFASVAIDTVPQALQVTEYIVTDSLPGVRRTDQLSVRLSRGLSLRDYEATSVFGADTARISGRVSDSSLVFASTGETSTQPITGPHFVGIVGATITMLLDEPEVGTTSTLRVIDPATGKSMTRATRVAAESLFVVVDSAVADSSGRWFAVHKDTVRAWRLTADTPPALDAWVDAQGLLVEARLENGLKLRRTAFELAFENWRLATPNRAVSARGDGAVISGTWLASGAPRPSVEADTLIVGLGATVPREFTTRLGRGFRARNQVVFARPPMSILKPRYALPASEKWQKVFVKELSPGLYIESDDPAIMSRAKRLAGAETDPSVIARRVLAWVHDSLEAASGIAPQSAARALASRRGDAREFALLATSLLRAVGIPAQPVTGLLQANGRFYMHAWTEVYLGRWVPMDAMLGQLPADASHIAFMSGAAEPGPDLARILSRLDISVSRVVPQSSPSSPAPR
jgi:hypothetical protein